jgi:hypothetical protein
LKPFGVNSEGFFSNNKLRRYVMGFDTVFGLILVCGGALIFTYWRGYVHGSMVRGDLDFDKMVSPHQDLTLGDVLKMIETFIATHHMCIEELVTVKITNQLLFVNLKALSGLKNLNPPLKKLIIFTKIRVIRRALI